MDFCGPESHLRKVQYRIWNPHQKLKSKKKMIEILTAIGIIPESLKSIGQF